jgi:peptidoglycan/LPS O-acetylase OafA/YrhL
MVILGVFVPYYTKNRVLFTYMRAKHTERNMAVDGLKGIAILIVLIHHFALAYYPSMINASSKLLHSKAQIEIFIFKTPLSIFVAGSFAVALFYLITGYVLTKQIIAKYEDKTYVPRAIYFRIFRLMPLIAVILLIGYVAMISKLTFNVPASVPATSNWFASFFPLGKITLPTIITEIFTKIPFVVSAGYYNVLWIIPYILFGSWLVYAFGYFFHESPLRFPMYAILLIAFYNTPYIAFLVGMALAENEEKIVLPQVVYYIFFVLSLIFGSSTFSALGVQGLGLYANLIKVLSAACFFLAFTRIGWLKWIAQSKPFVYFGINSYQYYLTHMLALIMLPTYVFLQMYPKYSYFYSVLTTFILYWPMTVLYSEILKAIEKLIYRKG